MITLNPGVAVLIFIVGGVAAVATYVAHQKAEEIGPTLGMSDLLPGEPFRGPPLPTSLLTKMQR